MEVKRNEIYRYLGYRGITPDDSVKEKVELCLQKLLEVAEPKTAWVRVPVAFSGEEEISLGDFTVKSRGLARNLTGCREAFLFAATVGLGVDRLIARAGVSDVTAAAIYQAAGAAAVEALSDELNEELLALARKEGLYGRPRFSPGYGDFSLEHQKDFERVLQMSKKLGISLSDSLLMTPSKSVTAVIGLSETDKKCQITGCEACEMRENCDVRRE